MNTTRLTVMLARFAAARADMRVRLLFKIIQLRLLAYALYFWIRRFIQFRLMYFGLWLYRRAGYWLVMNGEIDQYGNRGPNGHRISTIRDTYI